MPIILTYKTDQYKVKYGYCSKCFCYNEVWRKDKVSECDNCHKKLYHVSGVKFWLFWYFLLFSIIIYINIFLI